MRRNLVMVLLVAIAGITFSSCNKDEDVNTDVKNIKITSTITDNVVDFTVTAENAVSYTWDFGNGETAKGENVQTTYLMAGDYTVKCTAMGATSQEIGTEDITILVGDPTVDNEVSRLLTGYDEATGESTAVWYWKVGDMALSGGEKTYYFESDDADMGVFDPIDQSWWNEAGPSIGESYNDAYSFKLNKSFDYSCDYKDDGMAVNWAYAYHRYAIHVSMYSDIASTDLPKNGSWKIAQYKFEDYSDLVDDEGNKIIDSAPKTVVNGVEQEVAYYLELTGGAWMFQENAEPKYQILSITENEVFIRFATDLHKDFDVDGSWEMPDWGDKEWLSPGEGEWAYAYLVKNETAAPVEE